MLPFLKLKDDGVGVGPSERRERKPDEDKEDAFGMLEAVAEDMLHAIEKKDAKLLKAALDAFCMHIMDMDQEQDEQMAGE